MPKIITLSGSIAADGTILCGSGFTISHLAIGVYLITFDKKFFMKNPEVQLSISESGSIAKAKMIEGNLSSFRCFTLEYDPTTMYLKDYAFSFEAIGLVLSC